MLRRETVFPAAAIPPHICTRHSTCRADLMTANQTQPHAHPIRLSYFRHLRRCFTVKPHVSTKLMKPVRSNFASFCFGATEKTSCRQSMGCKGAAHSTISFPMKFEPYTDGFRPGTLMHRHLSGSRTRKVAVCTGLGPRIVNKPRYRGRAMMVIKVFQLFTICVAQTIVKASRGQWYRLEES